MDVPSRLGLNRRPEHVQEEASRFPTTSLIRGLTAVALGFVVSLAGCSSDSPEGGLQSDLANTEYASATGKRAIHFAASMTHTAIFRLLVEYGADVNSKKLDGNNAACMAFFNGDPELCQLVVESGADLNEPNPAGLNPLQLAMHEPFPEGD